MTSATKPLRTTMLLLVLSLGIFFLPTSIAHAAEGDGATAGKGTCVRPPSGYWQHGNGISLRPPPKCGSNTGGGRSTTCKPRYNGGRGGWRHGDGRSIKPPPNCGKGGPNAADTSTSETSALETTSELPV